MIITRSAVAEASIFGISTTSTEEYTHTTDSHTLSTNVVMTPPATAPSKQKIDLMRPLYTITRFDGTDPKRIVNVIKETEDYVKETYPDTESGTKEFDEYCLANITPRLDLSSPLVDCAYKLWKGTKTPTWKTFKAELISTFQPHTTNVYSAYTRMSTLRPASADLPALLAHVRSLNDPFETFYNLITAHEKFKTLLGTDIKEELRNYLYIASLLQTVPLAYHDNITILLSPEDSPSQTCRKLANAISQLNFSTPNTPVTFPAVAVVNHQTSHAPPHSMHVNSSSTHPHAQRGHSRHPHTQRGSTRTRASGRPQQQSRNTNPRSLSLKTWVPLPNTCYNCSDPSHFSSQCPHSSYCHYHEREGHSWRDCAEYSDSVRYTLNMLRQRRNSSGFGNRQRGQRNHQ